MLPALRIAGRLARLEARRLQPDDPTLMSWDEIRVRIMDRCRAIAAQETEPPEKREEALVQMSKVERDIREAARQRATDAYAAEIETQAAIWTGRKAVGAYVPALLSRESEDLDRPNIMRRRQALRDRADIRALIAAGVAG